MKIKDVINYLHSIAPNHLQEHYDNSGLLVGSYEEEVKGILVSLDVTEAVIEEAKRLDVNMIVSHHPIIFSGLKRITGANYIERIVKQAIKNDISLFAIHTNLDNVYEHGVNTKIAQRIGLIDTKILQPKVDLNDDQIGAGIIGSLKNPMNEKDFLLMLKEKMSVNTIKYTQLLGHHIQNVAICGGSGRFLLSTAIKQNADVFISSDFKYHEFFDADNQIVIADIGHYESEQFTIDLLHEILTEKFNKFAVHLTKVNTNPVNYL